MPILLATKAILESLIQLVHPILLVYSTELDIGIVLDVSYGLISSFLEVLTICVEPGFD